MEAFPFTRVGELPEGKKEAPAFLGLLNAEETRKVYGDGVFGGPYQVEDSIMNELFTACLKDILHLLLFDSF
jgi:creatinine amidohydrolase